MAFSELVLGNCFGYDYVLFSNKYKQPEMHKHIPTIIIERIFSLIPIINCKAPDAAIIKPAIFLPFSFIIILMPPLVNF